MLIIVKIVKIFINLILLIISIFKAINPPTKKNNEQSKKTCALYSSKAFKIIQIPIIKKFIYVDAPKVFNNM